MTPVTITNTCITNAEVVEHRYPVRLGSMGGCEVGPGDQFMVETPGGGGYGPPGQRRDEPEGSH